MINTQAHKHTNKLTRFDDCHNDENLFSILHQQIIVNFPFTMAHIVLILICMLRIRWVKIKFINPF